MRRFRLDKQLETRIEEADANAKLLTASFKLASSNMSLSSILDAVSKTCWIKHTFSLEYTTMFVPTTSIIMPLDSMFGVRRDGVSGSLSSAFGHGLQTFSSTKAEWNKITLVVRDTNGAPADFVVCDDITLRAYTVDGTALYCETEISSCVDGVVSLHYMIRDSTASRASIHVSVCGVKMGDSPWQVSSGFQNKGRHVRTYDTGDADHKYGLAVDLFERWMAVSSFNKHIVTYYKLPSGTATRIIGKHGSGPGEFIHPMRMCLCGPARCRILVCDSGNNRVQELDAHGVYVRELLVPSPFKIACNRDSSLIAVGRDALISVNAAVMLLDYASGAIVQTVGTFGSTACEGLRFAPSDDRILVARCFATLSIFALDGTLIKEEDDRRLNYGNGDVDFTENGDIVMASLNHRCIHVHAGDSFAFRSVFGGKGKKYNPSALTVAGNHLYVLDTTPCHCVRVFE